LKKALHLSTIPICMAHLCDAIAIACIDFRFQKYMQKWLNKNFKSKTFDYVGFAGSTKSLSTVMKQIDISVRLHHIKEVHLVHHEDCGAYGVESTPERHRKDLLKAKKKISKAYPKLKVFLYYLHLDGKFENIN
jgi:carbonic anhydrase